MGVGAKPVDLFKPPRGLPKRQLVVLGFAGVATLAGVAQLASGYEHAMDLWMFLNISFLARVWFWLHLVPDAYEIRSCDELSTAFESRVPLLFKHCIPAELTSWDFVFLPNSTQNLFPACDVEWTQACSFESHNGSRSSAVEMVPCSKGTLTQKMSRFGKPTPQGGNASTDTHAYMMDSAEREHVAKGLEAMGVVPPGFKIQGSAAIMVHLFSKGFSSARSFHSHSDRVFSFSMGSREWHVINPKHHSKFNGKWSINGAVMATRELVEAPRVSVVQERGDIFVMPPWWIHKTRPAGSSEEKGVNFNIHVFAEGQIVGEAARILHTFGLHRILLH